jgi:hypothetical protein
MKRVLGIALALASLGFTGFTSEAKATEISRSNVTLEANANPQLAQWERDRYGRRVYNRRFYNRRRVRVVRQSRVVRYGRRVYRETYVVRYLPNGMTDTRLISRIRIA